MVICDLKKKNGGGGVIAFSFYSVGSLDCLNKHNFFFLFFPLSLFETIFWTLVKLF